MDLMIVSSVFSPPPTTTNISGIWLVIANDDSNSARNSISPPLPHCYN
jgi:hypothetical protein